MSQDNGFEFEGESEWHTEHGGGGNQKILFERFRLVEVPGASDSQLGAGGMGVVHLAEDLLLKHYVALKLPPADVGRDAEARREMIEETKKGLRLTHSNIVRIFDFHDGKDTWGISMQYVEGDTLSKLRAEGRGLLPQSVTADEIRPWLRQVCEALIYAHEIENMVHRDLTPRNIMLEKRAGPAAGSETHLHAYVMDFGIADNIYHSMERTIQKGKATGNSGPGARPYISPEQLRGEEPKAANDIYSLGALLYDVFSSKPPFFRREGIEYQIETQAPPAIQKRRQELGVNSAPEIPGEWEELIMACLEKNPENRPASVREISNRLALNRDRAREADAERVRQKLIRCEKSLESAQPQRVIRKATLQIALIMLVAAVLGVAASWWIGDRFLVDLPDGVERVGSRPVSGTDFQSGLGGMAFQPVDDLGNLLVATFPVKGADFRVYLSSAMFENGAEYQAEEDQPVTGVSWFEAARFCVWLTEVERRAGNIGGTDWYELPSQEMLEEHRDLLKWPTDSEWCSDSADGIDPAPSRFDWNGPSAERQLVHPSLGDESTGFRCVLRIGL